MKSIIQIEKPKLIIYRDGEYSPAETWKPAIKRTLQLNGQKFAETLDRWFVEHKW